jgi:hypothetical protein
LLPKSLEMARTSTAGGDDGCSLEAAASLIDTCVSFRLQRSAALERRRPALAKVVRTG